MSNNSEWSEDYESILMKIHGNCTLLHEYHRQQYLHFNKFLKYFRIPTIVLSSFNVFVTVGLQPFVRQETVSLISCGISLVTGIINSIELFLNVYKRMEGESDAAKEYYLLSVDIYKTLALTQQNRPIDGGTYLQQTYATYCKLFEMSQVCETPVANKLEIVDVPLPLPLPHHDIKKEFVAIQDQHGTRQQRQQQQDQDHIPQPSNTDDDGGGGEGGCGDVEEQRRLI